MLLTYVQLSGLNDKIVQVLHLESNIFFSKGCSYQSTNRWATIIYAEFGLEKHSWIQTDDDNVRSRFWAI